MRKLLSLIVLSAALAGPAFTDDEVARPSSSPRSQLSEIVGASAEGTECLVVVKAEAQDSDGEQQFVLLTVRDGKIGESVLIGKDAPANHGYKTITYRGRFGLAWVEPGTGVQFASVQQRVPRVETILEDKADEGAIGDFWIIETKKGQVNLFVSRYRYVAPDGKPVAGGKQYTWLYAYTLHNDGPKVTGTVCMEDAELQCHKLACAAIGDDVVIWQIAYEKESLVETVRCAKWKGEGTLDWKDRYSGNEALGLLVDPTHGSTCLVQEWKSPIDASGIACCIGVDTTSVAPVGAYGGSRRQKDIRFLRVAKRKIWMIAFKSAESIELVYVNDALAPAGTVKVEAKGVTNYAVIQKQDAICMVFVRRGLLSCQEINLNSKSSPSTGVIKPAE
jgi:hypothetical protein